MREKPKRFSITLPQDLADRLEETQAAHYPRLSRREYMEMLIRAGLERMKAPSEEVTNNRNGKEEKT